MPPSNFAIARVLLLGATLSFGSHANARAEDWPHWRGPAANGISPEKGLNEAWPKEGPPILWKASVGLGMSSLVAAQGRVFTLGHAEETDTVFAFDANSGKTLWKHSYPSELGDKYFEGGTTGTPTVSGDKVYSLSRWGDLFCFEAASGKIVWQRQIQKDSGARIPDWGFSGAPTIHGNLLLLNVGESGMALDKSTGKTVWQSANKDPGYSTPLLWLRPNQPLALFSSGQGYVAVNPETGKEQWRMRWLTQYGVNASDPIIAGDQVFISTGYSKGAALIKPGPSGEPEVVWQSKVLRTQMNAAVLVEGHLYGFDGDNGNKAAFKCIELASGAEKWAVSDLGLGTVISVDGKLLVLGERGELLLAPASAAGFKPIARAQVLGGKSWTAPVLANGIVYCRNIRGDIAAVDLRKPR